MSTPQTAAGSAVRDRLAALGIGFKEEGVVKRQQHRIGTAYYIAYLVGLCLVFDLTVMTFIGDVAHVLPAIPGYLALVALLGLCVVGFAGHVSRHDTLAWLYMRYGDWHGRTPAAVQALAHRLAGEFGPDHVYVEFAIFDPYLLVDAGDGVTRLYCAHWALGRPLFIGAG